MKRPPLLDDTFPLALDAPFTRRMAHDAGLTDNSCAGSWPNNLLRHPIQNVYVPAQAARRHHHADRRPRLVVPDGCFVVDRTAAWLHGAPMALAPNDHLSAPKVSMFKHADAGRLRNDLARSGERTVLPRDLMDVGGLCVTTPLRTALDLGRSSRATKR